MQFPGSDKIPQYSHYVLLTDSPAIKRHYSEGFEPGTQVQIWDKNNFGRMVKSDKAFYTMPAVKIQFSLIEEVGIKIRDF
jgi:hypothetical protein